MYAAFLSPKDCLIQYHDVATPATTDVPGLLLRLPWRLVVEEQLEKLKYLNFQLAALLCASPSRWVGRYNLSIYSLESFS